MGDVGPVSEQDRERVEAGEAEAAAESPDVTALRKEIALLEGQLGAMRDRYVRAMADLDNARKRARHEMAEAQVRAASGVLLDVLSSVDNFERALETMAPRSDSPIEVKAMYDGVSLIYRQLVDMLARHGVRPIEAVGKPFDTHHHEAVVQVPVGDDASDGLVAVETQKGYLFGDRVLRPSKVGVAVREEGKVDRKNGEGESG
jgi:molecular chaperone GrpE